MFIPEKHLRRVLGLYLGGTKGGVARLRILLILKDNPSNINQLAVALHLDYTTVMYHMRILGKNSFVTLDKRKYSSLYSLSPLLEKNKPLLEEMGRNIG